MTGGRLCWCCLLLLLLLRMMMRKERTCGDGAVDYGGCGVDCISTTVFSTHLRFREHAAGARLVSAQEKVPTTGARQVSRGRLRAQGDGGSDEGGRMARGRRACHCDYDCHSISLRESRGNKRRTGMCGLDTTKCFQQACAVRVVYHDIRERHKFSNQKGKALSLTEETEPSVPLMRVHSWSKNGSRVRRNSVETVNTENKR
ncbi:hypothetical protein EJ04DRAFT_610195 [Polyplosphaeria fusca]|uniref:Secreted protein n=1 Tax=Polyplosphaeria fusca TaxID=682080 RepID=A0A9P4QVG9_9PLEO|nr:hypothetical protein EJ04DRAFT_610195 [Polyplosphaeria fusca]